MKFVFLVFLPLAAWGAPATPIRESDVSVDSLRPLIRTKRADEEIVFGNHQNEARVVKKSDPSLEVVKDEDVIESDVDKTDDVTDKDSEGNDGSEVFSDDAKSVSELISDKESGEDGGQDDEEDDKIIEESEEEEEVEDSSGEAEDEENALTNKALTSEEDYFQRFYPYAGMESYLRLSRKQKRAAIPGQLSTAQKTSDVSQRYKRDLTAEELYDWLENGNAASDAEDDVSGGYYVEDDGVDRASDDDIKELALELLEQEYPDEADNNVDYPIYQDYDQDSDENNKEMLSLLDYLEKGTPVLDKGQLGQLYPEHIQEEWDDLDAEPDQSYEPIVYQGVPGIFIPMGGRSLANSAPIQKRQYLSMLPGQKKRDFYPYNLEPVGGRWGAFVSPEEEKRSTSDAYDRLFRMAEALNPRNRDYDDYK